MSSATPNISLDAANILARLRRHVKSKEIDRDGVKWGVVYLHSARPHEMEPHQFAEHLSALDSVGLYRSSEYWKDIGVFGRVKI